MPHILARLLEQSWFGVLARIVLTFMFWGSGLSKLLDFQAGMGEMRQFGLEPAAAYNAATIFVQLLGSALVILNRWTWLGTGMLAVFTALTIPVAHAFWTMPEPQKTMEFYTVTEHVSVIGGLMIMAILSRRTGGQGNGGGPRTR